MKRNLESEYFTAVAKRTRASTKRFIEAKAYALAEKRNRRSEERDSDVVLLDSDEEDQEVEAVVKVDRRRGRGRGRSKVGFGAMRGEAWFDEIPDVELASSPSSIGNYDSQVVMFEEDEEEMDGQPVVNAEQEVNSIIINGNAAEGSGNGVVNENAAEGSGNAAEGCGNGVVFSSEEESQTEVSSSGSGDDDRDEDFDIHMVEERYSSESASDGCTDFVEEFYVGYKRQEESCGVECNENASPTDDVIVLYERTLENADSEENFVFNGSCSKPDPCVKDSVVNASMEQVCLSSPEVEVFEEEPAFVVKGSAMDGAQLQGDGFSLDVEGNFNKETSDVVTVPHITSTTRRYPNNSFTNKVSKTITDHGEDRVRKEDHFDDLVHTRDGTYKKVQKDVREEKSRAPNNSFANEVSKTITDHGEDRVRKQDHLNDLVRNRDGAYKKEQKDIREEKSRAPNSKLRARTWEKINAFDIFLNSLTSKNDAAHEDTVIASDLVQLEDHAEPKSYPMLKFTFGVRTPVQTEKAEFEKELDNLWDEFQFGLRASEIGSFAHETEKFNIDTSPKKDKIYPTFCNRGEHTFILDDQIGIKCQICSFVQLEMKYVMPNWGKSYSRKFDRRASFDDEDPEIFDGMQFQNSKVGESSYSDGTIWDLIPEVKDILYHHQQDGIEFIWMNLMGTISLDELRSSTNTGMGGCIISHAPGTGKTHLTIEFLHSYLELFPDSCPLIIAPAGMLLTWESEFKKWGVGIPFHNLNGTFLSGKEDTAALNIFNASKQSSNTHLLRLLKLLSWKKQKSILGLSYNLFEKLAGQRFDKEKKCQSSNKKTTDEQAKEFGKIILENAGLLVLDEGHTPRNPRSRIYKALTNIQTKKRIILSGTPFQNNLAELYTILSFVRPDFAQTISPELKKFCQRKVRMVTGGSGSHSDVDRDDREAISQLRCKIDPFVHVHKGGVLQESLPGLKDCVMVLNPPQYQKHIVEMIESSSYSNFMFEYKLSLGTIHPSLLLQTEDESFIDKAELEARRLDPNEGVKTKFLFEMIRLSEANNEKVLVFSQYLDPLGLIKDQICSLLHWREGKEVLQLIGKIDSEQRQSIINVFNDPRSSAKVLLASTKACSEGINLIGASRVVLLDVVWNPSVERQAISRAFRLGQKKVVYSYNLIVGRMEWEKYGAQANKEHVSNLVFCSNDEPEKRNRMLSEDKILDELITHSSMADMFGQIVYHPKDSLFS